MYGCILLPVSFDEMRLCYASVLRIMYACTIMHTCMHTLAYIGVHWRTSAYIGTRRYIDRHLHTNVQTYNIKISPNIHTDRHTSVHPSYTHRDVLAERHRDIQTYMSHSNSRKRAEAGFTHFVSWFQTV